jgi:hypothetical protein
VKACRLPVALLAALLALPAAASAAPPPTAPCAAVVAPGRPIELPGQIAPGLTVRVRDPYGGVFARNRLFVAFSVRYASRADRARVDSVTWTLDGAAPRRDEGGRDQLLAPSMMYAAGRHVVGVRIAPVGAGAPVEAEFQVTATDCRLAALSALPSARRGVVLTVASGGPALQAIELTPGSGRFGAPPGRRLGTMAALPGGRERSLRAGALIRAGRALRITGLAPGTTAVRVRLAAGVVAPGHRCALSAWLTGGAGPPVRVVQRC